MKFRIKFNSIRQNIIKPNNIKQSMRKRINVSVVDIVGRTHPNNSDQSTPSQSSNHSRSSHSNLAHQTKISCQAFKKSKTLQFDSNFVNNRLAEQIQAATKLSQGIAKGETFQNLLNMVKKYKKNRSNSNSFENSQSAKTQCYFSKKTTPQNSGRGVPDYNILHRSMQKLKDQDCVHPKKNKRTNSAPKKNKKVDYQNYISQNYVKMEEDSEKLDKILQQGFLKQKRKSDNITIIDNLESQQSKDQFRIEFEAALQKLNHDSHSHIRQVECFLNEKQLQTLLIELHYFKSNQKLSQANVRNKYCQKIFSQLGGNVYGGVVSQNVQQFLRVIEGIKNQSKFEYSSSQNQNRNHYIDENLKLKITQKQRKYIHAQYFSLRTHRVLHLQSIKKQASACQNQIKNKIQYKNTSAPIKKENKQNINKNSKNENNNPTSPKVKTNSVQQQNKTVQIKGVLQQKKENILQLSENSSSASDLIKKLIKKQQKVQINSLQKPQISNKTDSNVNFQGTKQPQKGHNSFLVKDNIENALLKRKPILSVDVNLGEGVTEKIIVYEGQSALQVANRLQQMFKIDENMKLKFQKMLQSHIRSLLWKIEEVSEQLVSDRQ